MFIEYTPRTFLGYTSSISARTTERLSTFKAQSTTRSAVDYLIGKINILRSGNLDLLIRIQQWNRVVQVTRLQMFYLQHSRGQRVLLCSRNFVSTNRSEVEPQVELMRLCMKSSDSSTKHITSPLKPNRYVCTTTLGILDSYGYRR